jgi:hypothetical protein
VRLYLGDRLRRDQGGSLSTVAVACDFYAQGDEATGPFRLLIPRVDRREMDEVGRFVSRLIRASNVNEEHSGL